MQLLYLQLAPALEQAIIPVLVITLPLGHRHQERPRQPRRLLIVEEMMAVDTLPVVRIDGVARLERRSRAGSEREVEIDEVVARLDVHLLTPSASAPPEKDGETYIAIRLLLVTIVHPTRNDISRTSPKPRTPLRRLPHLGQDPVERTPNEPHLDLIRNEVMTREPMPLLAHAQAEVKRRKRGDVDTVVGRIECCRESFERKGRVDRRVEGGVGEEGEAGEFEGLEVLVDGERGVVVGE